MKVCISCENEFTPKIERGIFCSDLCRATFNQAVRKNKDGGINIQIYILKNPLNDTVFYVGRTILPLGNRLQQHIKEASDGCVSKKRELISGILKSGQYPSIDLLEEKVCFSVEDEFSVNQREMYWIDYFKANGGDILNVMDKKLAHSTRPLLTKFFKHPPSHVVQFDEELLNKVKEASVATSPQKALNLYEKSYIELIEMKVAENNKPENKNRILAERESEPKTVTFNLNPIPVKEFKSISVKEETPPMPVKEKGEDSIDFAARKSEWKKKYNI